MSVSSRTDIGRQIKTFVAGEVSGIMDRRRVVGYSAGSSDMVETASFDPQDTGDTFPAVVPYGMQCMAGDDVILVKFGGRWFVGWILRRGA